MTSLFRKLSPFVVAPVCLTFLVTVSSTHGWAAPRALPRAAIFAQAAPGVPPSSAPGDTPPKPVSVSAENEAVGRRHYKRGDELFKQGHFLEAAREFEAGFAAAPRPLFLLNIGHSYRKAQDFKRARQAYEDFLKADPNTPYRADVEDLIKTIDDTAVVTSPPPPLPPSSSPSPATPPATSTTLPPSAAPAPIDLPRPVLVEVEAPASPDNGEQSRPLLRNPWFWGAIGVVVAAGLAGTIYAVTRPPPCNHTRCLQETGR